jgi:hypothetical protein
MVLRIPSPNTNIFLLCKDCFLVECEVRTVSMEPGGNSKTCLMAFGSSTNSKIGRSDKAKKVGTLFGVVLIKDPKLITHKMNRFTRRYDEKKIQPCGEAGTFRESNDRSELCFPRAW